jgi:hypothetical protein
MPVEREAVPLSKVNSSNVVGIFVVILAGAPVPKQGVCFNDTA